MLHSLSICWPELQEALATVQLWGLFRLKQKNPMKRLLFINQGCNYILLGTEEAEKPLYLIFDFHLEHEVDFLIITFCFSYLGPDLCPCSTNQQLLPCFLEQCQQDLQGLLLELYSCKCNQHLALHPQYLIFSSDSLFVLHGSVGDCKKN